MIKRLFAAASTVALLLLLEAPTALASPVSLILPQSTAFSVLGHSCGGIQEKSFATGFDPSSGYPTGDVYLSTSCGGSGRGGGYHTTTYSAWVSVTWDLTGVVVSYSAPGSAAEDPTFTAYDANGNEVYNQSDRAYLVLAAGYVPVPRVLAISVADGAASGGTSVAITGTGFTNATGVSFGGTAAASFMVNSDNSITATAPAAPAGTVDVTVTSGGGTSGGGTSALTPADQFTFVGQPSVAGVSPSSGPPAGGGTVTITGANLAAASSVQFGEISTSFWANPDGSLTAYVPSSEGETGPVDVVVTSIGGTSVHTRADRYTYVSGPLPSVMGVTPRFASPQGGGTITVTGTNFTSAATVLFGQTPADTTFVSSRKLTATIPPGSDGAVDVTVNDVGGTSAVSVKDLFAYGPPAVTSLTPDSGITGSTVTITGTGFAPGLAAWFGKLKSPSVKVLSGTSAVATVPNGAIPAPIRVGDSQGRGTSTESFTPTLSITRISPASAAVGGVVTINGFGFQPSSVVQFNGVAASSVTYVSASELQVVVPAGATTGRVTVTNNAAPSGTVRSPGAFTIT